MSEQLSLRRIEIFHSDTHDLLINNAYIPCRDVYSLMPVVKNGIPSVWGEVFPDTGYSIYRDSEVNPKFVAKVRGFASPQDYRDDIDEELRDRGLGVIDPDRRSFVIARNSLVNEIVLAPEIKRLVRSPEVEKLLRGNNFAGLSFVEPIIGSIERSTGKKIMYYPWQEGYGHGDEELTRSKFLDDEESKRVKDFTKELIAIFTANGVRPNDLHTSQYIFGRKYRGQFKLHLIDIEGYSKVSPESSDS